MDNVLFTVCARGGSKGVPNKNIRPLVGKPLIHYTLEAAIQSKISSSIVVTSDSDEILKVASSINGVMTLKRPAELATDTISKLPAIRHAVTEVEKVKGNPFDYIIDLDPTSPLRQVEDIVKSFEYFKNSKFENLITACPARRSPYFNLVELSVDGRVELSKTPSKPITCRQDSPPCFDMNASIYIWKRNVLFSIERVIDKNTGLFVMDPDRSVDIDHPIDFEIVELLMKKREQQGGR